MMKLFELYKSLYEHEVNVRNTYDGRMEFSFILLSFMAAAIGYVGSHVIRIEVFEKIDIVLLAMLMTSCAIFLVQLVLVFRAYFSFKYKYKDFPVNLIKDSMIKHMDSVSAKCKTINELEIEMSSFVEGMLFRTYEKCASVYYQTNIKKRKAHHFLNIMSFINIILLITMYLVIIVMRKGDI